MKYVHHFLYLVLLLLLTATTQAQLKSGADMYSGYIFRGSEYGGGVNFQPSLSYAIGDFTVGVWGAYSIAGGYSEADIWTSYALGPVTLYVTDYYIPAATSTNPFFNYNNNGEGTSSHVLEVGVGYTGPENLPISIAGYVNVLNDTNYSAYIQLSYPILEDLSLTVGLAPNAGVYTPVIALPTLDHPKSGPGLVSIGFTASKEIKVTETFSIPFNAQYILNPYSETAWLIFGITF